MLLPETAEGVDAYPALPVDTPMIKIIKFIGLEKYCTILPFNDHLFTILISLLNYILLSYNHLFVVAIKISYPSHRIIKCNTYKIKLCYKRITKE